MFNRLAGDAQASARVAKATASLPAARLPHGPVWLVPVRTFTVDFGDHLADQADVGDDTVDGVRTRKVLLVPRPRVRGRERPDVADLVPVAGHARQGGSVRTVPTVARRSRRR